MSKRNRDERRRHREHAAEKRAELVKRPPNSADPPRRNLMVLEARAHSGPLPDPRTIQEYENVLPGAAERIVSMGEREQKHRHRCDIWEGVYGFFGMMCGFGIGILGLVADVYLGSHGQPVLGGTVVTVTLGTLATAFIVGRKFAVEAADDKTEK